MQTSEMLKQARRRLTPATWGQGSRELALGKLCAGLAVEAVLFDTGGDDDMRCAMRDILHAVATGSQHGSISHWNDAPERTLQDVLDAYDAAIAIAEQQEQAARASAAFAMEEGR